MYICSISRALVLAGQAASVDAAKVPVSNGAVGSLGSCATYKLCLKSCVVSRTIYHFPGWNYSDSEKEKGKVGRW